MIVAYVILVAFALGGLYAWENLCELIRSELAAEIGAGESLDDAQGVRDPGGLTATLTSSVAGADYSHLDGLIDEVQT